MPRLSRTCAAPSAVALCLAALVLSAAPASAQDDAAAQRVAQLFQSIRWQNGPVDAPVGPKGKIKLPAGYQVTDRAGSQIWNQITRNPPDGTEATLMPSDLENDGWFLVFQFDEIGYVKDDEKGKLDANAILQAMKDGTEASNSYRKQQGWSAIHVDSWIQPPAYDETTKNLYWAVLLKSDGGGSSANYSTRLLGRRGVMEVTLVCDPTKMQSVIPKVKQLLDGFEFVSGEKYSEWKNGDKIAAYGLTGLITGGAAVLAAKSGLLAKLAAVFAKAGKAIVLGVVALFGGIWKFITGKKDESAA